MEPCSSNWKSQRLCNLVVPSDIRVVTSCGSCPCSKATVNDNPESFLSLKSDLAAEYPLVDAGSTAGGNTDFQADHNHLTGSVTGTVLYQFIFLAHERQQQQGSAGCPEISFIFCS